MGKDTELKLITFDQTSAKEVLAKLRREIERIENPAEREFAGDHVVNAFWTAWHLHEWLWDAIKEQPELKAAVLKYRGIDEEIIDDQKAFGAALARRFVPLKICRMIATSSKHAQVILPSESSNDAGNVSSSPGMQDLSALDPTSARGAPMVIIMGRPVVATRLLEEINDYWVTLIYECGVEQRE